jgi:hypothetical protein
MESAIQAYPALKGAFVVGAGRFQPALIIKPEDNENDNGLILEVWETVQRANAQALGHDQIDRELIMASKPERPFHGAGQVCFRITDFNQYLEDTF